MWRKSWLRDGAGRVGLGCMRLSTADDRDESRARATVHAALDAGVTVFDTALAYGRDQSEQHHNERWLGRFLSAHPRGGDALVVTKGGLVREGVAWVPDGRAKALRAQCEASLAALGRPIDLYLLHTPDPRVPWATSVRALESLRRDGLVRAIGVSNVTRAQLDEAASLAELAAVQVALSVFDETNAKSGVLARALSLGLTVQAHTPLGGPKRATTVDAVEALGAVLALDPLVMVLPGATRPETITAAARASPVKSSKWWTGGFGEVVTTPREEPGLTLLMGPQGAGKTTAALQSSLTRLNRDLMGGTLKSLHAQLDAALARGDRGFVLDNTYVTRAQRYDVLRVAEKYAQAVHGRWFDVSAVDAQVNIVTRMLHVHGRLLAPDELLRGTAPDTLGPGAHFRTWKTVELPELSEGFTSLDVVSFVRRAEPDGKPALFVGVDALEEIPETDALVIVVGWKEGGLDTPHLNFVCPHPGGPPTCWCRPPLPGAFLAAARAHGVSLAKSRLLSSTSALQSAWRAVSAGSSSWSP